jgi:glycylpeptide N-tetradecanoyltransferase
MQDIIYSELNTLDKILQIRDFLYANFFQDEDKFRFIFSIDYLTWKLSRSIVLIKELKGEIISTLIAIPCIINVRGNKEKVLCIDLMCVKKEFRKRRIAADMIEKLKTLYRSTYSNAIYLSIKRVNNNIITNINYYHYPLNIKKIIDCRFFGDLSSIRRKIYLRLYSGSKSSKLTETKSDFISKIRIRPANKQDIDIIYSKYIQSYNRFDIYRDFESIEEFKYWILQDFLCVRIIENKDENKILDFFSFYFIDSEYSNTKEIFKVAYLYYYSTTSLDALDVFLIAAEELRKLKYDLINCFDIMNNKSFIEALGLIKGTGNLKFFDYNNIYNRIENKRFGFIMP